MCPDSQTWASTATIAAPRSSPPRCATPGMEVIYTGLHQTPEMIATAAVQEDVDVVGLSILSGAHMTLFPRVLDAACAKPGRDDILITGGGIIPKEDMDALQRARHRQAVRPRHADVGPRSTTSAAGSRHERGSEVRRAVTSAAP